ncbi:MAG: TolC family protein [Prevotella sp.]|nr:TolC family protein [Prevotella sp.]
MTRRLSLIAIAFSLGLLVQAQEKMTLEDCRQLALNNNKQLSVARLGQDIASSNRAAARTHYLPKVDAMAGYELMSKEVSILNDKQKTALNNLGTTAMSGVGNNLNTVITDMAGKGIITPELAQSLGQYLGGIGNSMASMGNELGSTIRQAFRTNNRNTIAGSVMVRQPLYMGGAITALNRIAELNEVMASENYDMLVQNTLYEIDATYWLVVSLKQKQRLAESYLELVKQFDVDVHKMIDQGVSTRAEGLSVDVRVNEAEMTKMKVDDNLILSKMLLCQLCGLPMDYPIILADEDKDLIPDYTSVVAEADVEGDRPELRMLQTGISLSEQASKILTATYHRPQIALTGGYLVSNPNLYNGFEHKFSGVWNIGLLVRMPLWDWHEGRYKIRASKAATTIAQLERSDLLEKINLQVEQHRFRYREALRRMEMSKKHVSSAEENLRCATVGFREGVMSLTEVMTAQTAWQAAHSEKIDSEIEVQLSQVALRKALGQLR